MRVSGWASTPNKDRIGDIILPEAFVGAVFDFAERAHVRENHCKHCVVGRVLKMNVTPKGLYIEAHINEDAVEVRRAVREGKLHSFSVSIKTLKARRNRATGTRIIEAVRLIEISLVDDPLCPGTELQLMEERGSSNPTLATLNARIEVTSESLPELRREVIVRELLKFASQGRTAKEMLCFLNQLRAA
ncbi:MAG: hypothetical protein A2428_03700 [Bdellovibrionales bacterium RIFOXYC1_FULL_54_43]|nr:MAG: hypothetical protein A2428_03700 [Bdellovibrionales bacterium RIFOXYC1_FULL_54_43]OFZ83816.1 MAG: hypothetical protein A2603_11125 [Bdellovibrionales bacterium RIFOXYD1_FULL_55_31]